MDTANTSFPIVFYDGECLLCSRAIDFILKNEQGKQLLFAPIGGSTYNREVIKLHGEELPDSLILLLDGKLYTESMAIFMVLPFIKSPYRWIRFLKYLPRIFTDWVYRWIASNRNRWFGTVSKSCRVGLDSTRVLE